MQPLTTNLLLVAPRNILHSVFSALIDMMISLWNYHFIVQLRLLDQKLFLIFLLHLCFTFEIRLHFCQYQILASASVTQISCFAWVLLKNMTKKYYGKKSNIKVWRCTNICFKIVAGELLSSTVLIKKNKLIHIWVMTVLTTQ